MVWCLIPLNHQFHNTSAISPVAFLLHKAVDFLTALSLPHRSESSCSCLGPFEPDYDGNGLHLYRHVSQQRSALLSQASLLLFHPVRWDLIMIPYLRSVRPSPISPPGYLSRWCGNAILLSPLYRRTGPPLCPDIPPVCAGLAVQWPLRTFTPWAVLVCGLCGLSWCHSYSWRFPLHHPRSSFQPLAEMLATQE